MTTVQEAVGAYMPSVQVTLPAEPCARCRCSSFSKMHEVDRFPRVLQIALNRWATHTRGGALLHPVAANPNITFKTQSYSLRSGVIHLGPTPNSGHYIAVSRHDTANGQWWLYDDDRRVEAKPQEVSTLGNYRAFGAMQRYALFYER